MLHITSNHSYTENSTFTECFFNKNGKCYYAGVYRCFRLEDLTTKEWEALSNEVRQSLSRFLLKALSNLWSLDVDSHHKGNHFGQEECLTSKRV